MSDEEEDQEIDRDALTDFLRDLRELALKHGVKVGGCGCCGSPVLLELEDEEWDGFTYVCDQTGEHLRWKSVDSIAEEIDRRIENCGGWTPKVYYDPKEGA